MFASSFRVVLSCVGIDLCNELIIRPKESYRVSKIYYETSVVKRSRALKGL
jgi:hypothetical protein